MRRKHKNLLPLYWKGLRSPTGRNLVLKNRSFRRELLDAHLFRSLAHVCQLVDEWMLDYNTPWPHQALNIMTPIEFKQAA